MAGKIYIAILFIIYRAIADISYIYFISPYYEYMGFKNELVLPVYIMSWLLYVIVIPLVKVRFVKYIDFISLVYVLFLLAPLTSLYGLSNAEIVPPLLCVISFYIIYIIGHVKNFKILKIKNIKNGAITAKVVSLLSVLFLIIWFLKTGAVNNYTLDLQNVYGVREANRELAGGGIFTYVNMWVMKIFISFLIAINLKDRKYHYVVVLFIIQIFFFSVSGHKSVLFFPLMVMGIWFIYKYRINKSYILIISSILLIVIPYSIFLGTGEIFISSMLIRRLLFLPAELNFVYFDYFQNHEYLYWSNSVLEFVFHYPYENPIPEVIGYEYGFDAHTNNGFISMGYAHLGIIGVLLYAISIGIVIRFLDTLIKKGIPNWIVISLTIIPIRAMIIQSDFFTQMLTGGLIIAILLLYLIRNQYHENFTHNYSSQKVRYKNI